ncbi:MAG TPA: hypothetical protein VEK05_02760 [Burkholderiales bacterium]|nr:hypothetical protein [Burkholderiales bacterium]
MSETQSTSAAQPAQRRSFVAREFPYILLLVLAVVGIAYTSVSPDSSAAYWKVLAPVFAVVCIVSQWPRVAAGGGAKTRLIVIQLVHWGAFLFTILLVFLPGVQTTVTSVVSAQIILYLLALSTFLAGLHNVSWQLMAVGVLMALSVPAIAYLERSVLLGVVIVAAVVLVIVAYVFQRRRVAAKPSSSPSASNS